MVDENIFELLCDAADREQLTIEEFLICQDDDCDLECLAEIEYSKQQEDDARTCYEC